jgi:tetratricopeptide (TPR) repeat protein
MLPSVRIQAVEDKLAALTARLDAMDLVLEWLGLTIAIVGVGFGALITLTVVFFALRTEQSAVAAARKEIQGSREIIDAHVATVTEAAAGVVKAAGEIEEHRLRAATRSKEIEASAEEIAEIVKKSAYSGDVGAVSRLTEEEKLKLSVAAQTLAQKPLTDLSEEEFEVIVTSAYESRDWERALNLAITMRTLFPTEATISSSLLTEAIALCELGQGDEGVKRFDQVIEKFKDSQIPTVKARASQAMYNKALFISSKDPLSALNLYNQIIQRFDADKATERVPTVARALCNRAAILHYEDRDLEALADLDRVMDLIGPDRSKSVLEPLAGAMHNRAIFLANGGKSTEAITHLDAIVTEFQECKESAVQEIVQDARTLLNSLRKRKRKGRQGRQAPARAGDSGPDAPAES